MADNKGAAGMVESLWGMAWQSLPGLESELFFGLPSRLGLRSLPDLALE